MNRKCMDDLKVLVVDCNRDFLDSVSISLKRYNYNVFSADDIETAIELLHTYKFDIVVAELQKQEDGGVDIVSYISSQFPDIKLLLMSSYFSESEIASFQYLAKPFSDVTLVEKIKQQVDRGKFN